MKYLIKTFLLLLFGVGANAQQQENIIIGKKDSIHSDILGENRALWIYTPNLTSKKPISTGKYPVMFVLDGEAHFYSTVGIVQQLSQVNGNDILPEMIVVSIESTDRRKDFVPNTNTSNTIEGANSFVQFLAKELIPFIDEKYNAAPYRILAGHSLGGLLAVDVLSNYPSLFNAYIAIDPSMWYGEEKFLNQFISTIKTQAFTNNKLFVGVANTLPEGVNLSMLKNNAADDTKHIRAIFKLTDFLKNTKISGLKYQEKYYQNENHSSVPLLSEYDGLRFIFDYYRLNATEKDFADSTSVIASKIRMHYEKITKEMGYKVVPAEGIIQYFGYDALAKKQFDKARALFQLNMDYHPESGKVYDAYADYFVAKKETENAIKYYKIALSKNADSSVQNKLNMLTNPGSFKMTEIDLTKYAGVYTILPYNIDMEFYIKENKLWSKVPGEPDEELSPASPHVFTLKNKQGYTITFHVESNKITGFTSEQPDGTFKAVAKSK